MKVGPINDSLGFANFLEVVRIAMRATVVACAAPVTIMLPAVMALVDVAKCKGGRFRAAFWARAKRFVV